MIASPLGRRASNSSTTRQKSADAGFQNLEVFLDFAFLLGRRADHGKGARRHILAQFGQRLLARLFHVGGARQVLALRHAAHVEGAHGQLGARLADGLRGDDADGLAGFDGGAGRHVGAVAVGAQRRAPAYRSGSSAP